MTVQHAISHVFVACVLLAGGCGDDETSIILVIDLSGHDVPSELSAIHVELSDESGRFVGRNLELAEGQRDVRMELLRGTLTPKMLVVRVLGFLGTNLVASSDEMVIEFEKGERREVQLSL